MGRGGVRGVGGRGCSPDSGSILRRLPPPVPQGRPTIQHMGIWAT